MAFILLWRFDPGAVNVRTGAMLAERSYSVTVKHQEVLLCLLYFLCIQKRHDVIINLCVFIWEESFHARNTAYAGVKTSFPTDGKEGQRARQMVTGQLGNISLFTKSVSFQLPSFSYLGLHVCIIPKYHFGSAINAPPSSWCLLKMTPTLLTHQSSVLTRLVASSLSLPTDSQFLHLFYLLSIVQFCLLTDLPFDQTKLETERHVSSRSLFLQYKNWFSKLDRKQTKTAPHI